MQYDYPLVRVRDGWAGPTRVSRHNGCEYRIRDVWATEYGPKKSRDDKGEYALVRCEYLCSRGWRPCSEGVSFDAIEPCWRGNAIECAYGEIQVPDGVPEYQLDDLGQPDAAFTVGALMRAYIADVEAVAKEAYERGGRLMTAWPFQMWADNYAKRQSEQRAA